MSKVFGPLVIAIALAIAPGATARSGENPATPFEVDVPEDAVVFANGLFGRPVWCGSSIVAIPGVDPVSAGGERRWIRFYNVDRGSFVEESVPNLAGGIIACNDDASERATVLWESDSMSFGSFEIVSHDSQRTTKLVEAAALLSADSKLRAFIFATGRDAWSPGWWGPIELLTVDDAGRVHRTRDFGNVPHEAISTAAVSNDGRTLAVLARTTSDRMRLLDPSALDLVVSGFGERTRLRVGLNTLMKDADLVETMFIDQDKIVVVAATGDRKLVVATCPVTAKSFRQCESVTTAVGSDEFSVLGVGSSGFIFASREELVGDKALRGCLFEGKGQQLPPPTCRTQASSAPVYGMYPPELFALSPDRRRAAVRSKFRSSTGAPHGLDSVWSLVPLTYYGETAPVVGPKQ